MSDEGNNLVNAAKLLELPHLADISHLVATCLKKTFEDRADYKAFSTAVNKCQAKLARGKYCYLRPLKQRVIPIAIGTVFKSRKSGELGNNYF